MQLFINVKVVNSQKTFPKSVSSADIRIVGIEASLYVVEILNLDLFQMLFQVFSAFDEWDAQRIKIF